VKVKNARTYAIGVWVEGSLVCVLPDAELEVPDEQGKQLVGTGNFNPCPEEAPKETPLKESRKKRGD